MVCVSVAIPHQEYGMDPTQMQNQEQNNGLVSDCKTVRIFAYSSTREQSNKRCGTRLKTESQTGERR